MYICFAERGWSVSVAAPASTSCGPISRQVREPFARPRRIFTETGSEIASATASTIAHARAGSSRQCRARAGLRHLADGAAEVDVDDVRAGVLDHARRLGHHAGLGAEDLNRERMLVGRDPQVAERALVPVREPGAADHLRADEPGAEAAALAAEGLHAHARHRREDEPGRDLDGPDPPGFVQIYLHRGQIVAADPAFDVGRRRIGTMPARDGAFAPRIFF